MLQNELLILSGILLFIGAMGKFKFHFMFWLPDAMAGPTPISVLIHAATMVTTGIYMVARFHFLYSGIEKYLGLFIKLILVHFSALLAAIITATRQSDIKKFFLIQQWAN